ncbi:MAG: DNA polymerase III subunit gamma/tau [Desulfobulbaceae bacterium]|nr:DNA polymerase III subunit gamma/tau [Desulfobulbaceae bacterium]
MSYLVLARKSRPQSFAEVVGQQTVVRTLQNALTQNRVPHGLIFSGIRGTGKTTLARIMAKALNCEQGPTPNPCGTCRSCLEIAAGNSVDLHEIDGASNRGIQEIRDLKEKIRFMPTSARFKIIIIDEVHMLTTEAFNALLKTLEEPPEHVYFMFATTELHKVPVTILSRCQRYELQRVGHRDLAAHFTRLAGSEGVTVEPAAIDLIVREASGSVRDGLSLLDQVFSYCGEEVKADEVAEVLGLVSHQVIGDLSMALLAGDIAQAMELLVQVYAYGMNIKRFSNELLSWFRSLILCSLSKNPEKYLDLPEEDLTRLSAIASEYTLQTLSSMFKVLLEGLEKANYSSQPRLAIEMAFIQAVQVGDVQPVTKLLSRLDDVLAGVPLSELVQDPAGSCEKKTAAPAPAQEIPAKQQPAGAEGRQEEPPAPAAAPVTMPEPSPAPIEQAPEKEEQPTLQQPPPAPDVDSGEQSPAAPTAEQRNIRQHWPEFIEYVRDRKPWMAAALQRSSAVELKGEQLVIQYEDSIDCNLLKNREHITPLTEFALDFFQQTFTISFQVPETGSCEVDPNGAVSPKEERKALARDPLVLTALEVFNGQVGDIRVGPRFRTALETESVDTDTDASKPET